MAMANDSSPEVLIVGGGVIGLMLGRALLPSGRSVCLLESGQPGQQASWASAGLVADLAPRDTDPVALLRHPCVEDYELLSRELVDETGVDIEYVRHGWIIVALDDEQADLLAQETARQRALGVETELVQGPALREAEPGLGPRILAARLTPGGQLEPRRLVRALAISFVRRGGQLLTGRPALAVLRAGERVTGVRTETGDVLAEAVVIAAGSWSGLLAGCDPPIKVGPQRGQILALRPRVSPIRRVVMRVDDPYLASRASGRFIVGATREFAGYDRSLTAGGVGWLLSEAISMVPDLADASIDEMWTGFRPLSADGLPIIGPASPDGLFYATGHGPSGIMLAPGTVRGMTALLGGNESPIPLGAFAPQRFSA